MAELETVFLMQEYLQEAVLETKDEDGGFSDAWERAVQKLPKTLIPVAEAFNTRVRAGILYFALGPFPLNSQTALELLGFTDDMIEGIPCKGIRDMAYRIRSKVVDEP